MQLSGYDNKISIIVCTYNRLSSLKNCLASLELLDYPNYEIIVVNDCSHDGTGEFLDSIQGKQIINLNLKENSGPSEARNLGAKNASGEILAFIDDDCLADNSWLKEINSSFKDEKVDFTFGQIYYVHKDYRGYFPERLVRNLDARWPMAANLAFRKNIFDNLRGFDKNFDKYHNEDSELALRALSTGYKYKKNPSAIVNHTAMDWSVKSLLASARNASVWPVLKKNYPKIYTHFGPPIKFGFIINAFDYLYFIFLPILLPILLIRYRLHGKKNLKIFFAKWPICLLLRRYYIYKEAVNNKILML